VNTEALAALRLRTPNLELRLADEAELCELFAVAQAGIHLPDEMPFSVAWTDDLRLDAFLAFHHAALENWRAEQWHLALIVLEHGKPIGNQSVEGERFAETHRVKTGSWLGRSFQGRGLGTEMRAAVLQLAFHGLGAATAESGALEGNAASARVSEKLGYRHVGWSEVAPRGVAVAHQDFELDRADWEAAFPVEIHGLGPALPLFGLS
jgi:RimJ/RimL family protein N-acetyltransferase